MHFFSTLMVFTGSVFSSVWIVIANSWMHTPAGYHLVSHDGVVRAEITDFWAMIFNPSSMHRLAHVLLGAIILGAFFVMSVMAYYVVRKRHDELARLGFRVGLIVAAVSSVAMLVSGHSQARALAHNQPGKLAALEAHFETGEGPTDLYVIGWPNPEARTVDFGIALPGMLSFLIYDDFETPVPGLETVPEADRPPVMVPFLSYHLMVGCGMYFIGLTLLALFLLWRGTLFDKRWLMWVFVGSVVAPYLANEAGWVATEVGRQPWIVYRLLRTSDAVSRSVAADQVVASIVLFGLIYIALVVLWLVVMNEKIAHGPTEPSPGEERARGTSATELIEAAGSFEAGRGRLSMTGGDAEARETHRDEEE
jgi:cytochrome d ubiquinol oxidase subunit I